MSVGPHRTSTWVGIPLDGGGPLKVQHREETDWDAPATPEHQRVRLTRQPMGDQRRPFGTLVPLGHRHDRTAIVDADVVHIGVAELRPVEIGTDSRAGAMQEHDVGAGVASLEALRTSRNTLDAPHGGSADAARSSAHDHANAGRGPTRPAPDREERAEPARLHERQRSQPTEQLRRVETPPRTRTQERLGRETTVSTHLEGLSRPLTRDVLDEPFEQEGDEIRGRVETSERVPPCVARTGRQDVDQHRQRQGMTMGQRRHDRPRTPAGPPSADTSRRRRAPGCEATGAASAPASRHRCATAQPAVGDWQSPRPSPRTAATTATTPRGSNRRAAPAAHTRRSATHDAPSLQSRPGVTSHRRWRPQVPPGTQPRTARSCEHRAGWPAIRVGQPTRRTRCNQDLPIPPGPETYSTEHSRPGVSSRLRNSSSSPCRPTNLRRRTVTRPPATNRVVLPTLEPTGHVPRRLTRCSWPIDRTRQNRQSRTRPGPVERLRAAPTPTSSRSRSNAGRSLDTTPGALDRVPRRAGRRHWAPRSSWAALHAGRRHHNKRPSGAWAPDIAAPESR